MGRQIISIPPASETLKLIEQWDGIYLLIYDGLHSYDYVL